MNPDSLTRRYAYACCCQSKVRIRKEYARLGWIPHAIYFRGLSAILVLFWGCDNSMKSCSIQRRRSTNVGVKMKASMPCQNSLGGPDWHKATALHDA